jgi:acyl-CoA synthetase (AMP-forming)/AMP-acid ligase II
VERALLAPGGYFETHEEGVLGERMRVFKRRPRSLRDLLTSARAFGDSEYLVFVAEQGNEKSEERISFRALEEQVAQVAEALRDRFGVKKGDRVAIFAANCPEWIITFWATVSLGAIAVGLNGWWTGAEARFAIEDVEPKILIADEKRLARFGPAGPPVPTAIVGSSFRGLRVPHATLPEDEPIAEDDPAVILFTSGTTGRPKGVVHSHRNVLAYVGANAFHGARTRMVSPPPPLRDGSPPPPNCALVTSPLFHVSGLHSGAVACLAAGVRSVWPVGKFDPKLVLRLIERERVTGWGFTSTMLHRVVNAAAEAGHAYDTSSLRQLGGGGSPIAPLLQARAREALPNVRATLGVGYGLTECGALATLNPGDELRRFPRSVGRPLPTIDVTIRDADGSTCEEGEEGEVCVKSPLVMLEYWRRPEATRAAFWPGRWLRTGDIGCIREGRLYLTTRRHDLILRGGENVYPAEIEQRLEEHPRVAEAAVIGVPHPDLGEEPKAVVVPAPGAVIDEAELVAWVAAALAYFKVPARWEIRREPLPRNATGKVMKHALGAAGAGLIEE